MLVSVSVMHKPRLSRVWKDKSRFKGYVSTQTGGKQRRTSTQNSNQPNQLGPRHTLDGTQDVSEEIA